MPVRRYSNIIGFDDAPFPKDHQGNVKVIGTVYAGLRFDGVIIGEVTKDGSDASQNLIELIAGSKFAKHVQLILFQGITLAGFNVIDVFHIHKELRLPVLIVARNLPDRESIKKALLTRITDGDKKWKIIKKLGQMEPLKNIYIQRVGVELEEAVRVVERFAIHSNIPEPVRTAHLIAGAIEEGQSRGDP